MEYNSDDELERAIALSLESVVEPLDTTNHPPLSQPGRSQMRIEGESESVVALSQGSEQHPKSQKGRTSPINLISDDEDDDLDAPVQIRNSSPRRSNREKDDSERTHCNQPQERSICSSAVNKDVTKMVLNTHARSKDAGTSFQAPSQQIKMEKGLSGMNRKQMEEERLARASLKRKREDYSRLGSNEPRARINNVPAIAREVSGEPNLTSAGPSRAGHSQLAAKPTRHLNSLRLERVGDTVDNPVAECPPRTTNKRHAVPNEVIEVAKQSSPESSSNTQRQKPRVSEVQFPEGVVRKTWAYGYPRHGDDIKIEEVLQKADLELAVLSSFQIEPEWISSKLNDETKVIWVLQAKTEAEKQNWRLQAPPNYRFCFPAMGGNVNCMHSKLQLLSHPTHLRVVVPSANLTAYDWGETGVMENTCFLIDLPRRPDSSMSKVEDIPAFGRDLIYFITALGLDQTTVDSLLRFDFSGTKELAFIHTIGGSTVGDSWKRTGYCGLGAAVQNLGLHTEGSVSVDFVASSIGNLNEEFVRSMYLAAKGDDGLTEYRLRMNKSAKTSSAKATETTTALWQQIKSCFRVYFPLQKTVEQSKGGTGAAGTICFQEKWFNATSFPRSLMRDCKSRRTGMLMHNKMMFVMHLGGNSGWAYIGSANFSESAWGRLVKDRTTKEPKLNCRNWECGVLIPFRGVARPNARCELGTGLPSLDLFNGLIPIPFEMPAAEYNSNKPWFYST